jgi:hypothetical protein
MKNPVIKTLSGFLFTVFLILSLASFSSFQVTEYGTLKNIFTDFIALQFSSDEQKNTLADSFSILCSSQDEIQFDLTDIGITIGCSRFSGGFESAISAIFDSLYKKDFQCDLLDCMKYSPVIFSTEKGNEILRTITVMLFILTILSGILFAISLQNPFKGIGLVMLSLIFMYLPFALAPKQIDVGGIMLNIGVINSTFAFNFLVVAIIGAALTAVGFAYAKQKKK